MMLRKLAVSLAVAGIIGASNANALGLGEIKVHSALNEPLKAEIKLLQVKKLRPLQIQPRMADIDDFALAGLSKARFLSDVRFQVKVNPDGTGTVLVTSERPVREPFLNFLVELNWPNGRLVREYTLLLDPPVFDPTPVRQTVQPALAAPSTRSTQPRSRATAANQVYVDVKDTLWEIATRHRPDSSVSANQMMIALLKKNPHAFVNNNINRLKAGVVLDIPSREEIAALNAQQASQEVKRQAADWRSGNKAAKKKASAKTVTDSGAATRSGSPGEDKTPEAELKIVTPKEQVKPEKADATGAAEGDMSADGVDAEKAALLEENRELEERLNESLENVDKVTRDNEELNERLDSIQYELEQLRKMLELKDRDMALLQQQMAAAQQKAAEKPESSLMDKLLSPWLIGGVVGGLLALLAAIFFLLRRRKDDGEEVAEKADSGLVQVPEDVDLEPEGEQEVADDIEEQEVADDIEELSVDDLDLDDDVELLEDEALLMGDDLDLDDSGDLEELDDLDLDMDMGLDLEEEPAHELMESAESAEDEVSAEESLLDDDEFDLGLDDLDEEPEVEQLDTTEDVTAASDVDSDDLDAILDGATDAVEADELDAVLQEGSAEESVEESDELDDLLAEDQQSDEQVENVDLTDDLDALLAENAAEEVVEAEESVEVEAPVETEEAVDITDDVDALLEEGGADLAAEDDSALEEVVEGELEFSVDQPLEGESEAEDEPAVAEADDALDFSVTEAEEAVEEPEVADYSDDETDLDFSSLEEAEIEKEIIDEHGLDQTLDVQEAEEAEQPEQSATTAEADLEELISSAEPELPGSLEKAVEDDAQNAADAELDSMLDELGIDLEEEDLTEESESPTAEDELAATIEHDLEADLDNELEALLSSDDNDIELEESDAADVDQADDEDPLDELNLLDGADEVETKLDLARAYIDMEDYEGAKDILNEIVAEGSDAQREEAEALIQSINE